MEDWVRLVGPERALEVFGVTLIGVSAESAGKLLVTLAFIVVVQFLQRGVKALTDRALQRRGSRQTVFWANEGRQLVVAVVLVIGVVSIWIDNPGRSAAVLGLITAGLAFALQKLIAACAAYFIILRGDTFHVGDRIKMGGVRGDVISLSLMQTTILEMGQPPAMQGDDPAVWVRSRQYTGRVVTVSNAVLFDQPVYNYSRELPYIWEELVVPIAYSADREAAERILLQAAERHTAHLQGPASERLRIMAKRHFVPSTDAGPRVYLQMTDNWLELSLRFISEEHGARELKDAITREVLGGLEAAGIGIASATFEIVGLPPLRLERRRSPGA